MKRLTKILFVAGGALLLTGGAVANYLLAQQETLQEELTLANLEAMAFMNPDEDTDPNQEKKYSYSSDGSSCTIAVGTQILNGYKPLCFSGFSYPTCADCVVK